MSARAARALAARLALAAALGCGGQSHEAAAPHAEHEEQESEHGGDVESGPLHSVAIDPEMLRDLRITTARAEARAGGDAVTALGEVQVNEDAYAEVGTPVPARVVQLLASPGQQVQAAEVLAELESPALGQARAALLSARARSELARQALARVRGLVEERIAPRRELEQAQAEAAATSAELHAAQAALGALGAGDAPAGPAAAGARFALRAPLAGTVLERGAARGQQLDPATPLFRIGDLSRLWLTVHAFERDALRMLPGATASVRFAALPGREFAGSVALIGSQVERSSRTIAVRIELENRGGLLRPGMSASARVPLGDAGPSVVAVPAAALQRTQDGWCVFLPRGPGRFERRSVGRGRDLGGEVEVVSGLAAGETLVVEGAFVLKAEAEKARGTGGHHAH